MTQNKAQKTAARQRMAETGEPYSVARRAVAAPQSDSSETGQILVRYRLDRTFELEVDPGVWAKADSKTRARLISESESAGSFRPGTTLAELIAGDLDARGTDACTTSAAGKPARDWEEEYYADGAASEGITVEEFKAREVAGQAEDWPPEGADEAQKRADLAQERADLAQERANREQERADREQERAGAVHSHEFFRLRRMPRPQRPPRPPMPHQPPHPFR